MQKFLWVLLCLPVLTGCAPRQETPALPTTVLPSPTPAAVQTTPWVTPSPTSAPQRKLKVYVKEEERMEEMSREDYLCGVVAGEMRGDWPQEALKAQAVVARTFMEYFLRKEGGSMYEGADLSTDTAECQAFDADGVNDVIRQAVRETADEWITWQGKPIIAWFHSCSGGRTATAAEGLAYGEENPPYLQGVDSDESLAPEDFRTWEAAFSREEVEAALETLGIHGKLTDAAILKRGASGRSIQLSIGGRTVDAVALRMALGPKQFRSTLITSISVEDGWLLLEGKGFGHGVGMSQWGAYTMARQGKDYRQILAHYYTDTEIQNVNR